MKATKGIFGLAAAALFVGAGSVQAATVTVTDLADITKGNQVASSTSDFLTPEFLPLFPAEDIGDLASEVWNNNGLYTYIYRIDPDVVEVSEVNTGFEVLGFNGIAGWDFTAAGLAGGDGDADDFDIVHSDTTGTLDWNSPAEFFGLPDSPIAFFFQSSFAPNSNALISFTNSETGSAVTFAMVPTPTAALIGLPMLGLLSLGRRRREQK